MADAKKPKKRPLALGVVFYIDTTKLNQHPRVRWWGPTPVPDGKRPFLCVAVDRLTRTSLWAPITSQYRPERQELFARWLVRRSGSFLQGSSQSWLNGLIYEGPNAAFTAAEAREPGRKIRNRFAETTTKQLAGVLFDTFVRRTNIRYKLGWRNR